MTTIAVKRDNKLTKEIQRTRTHLQSAKLKQMDKFFDIYPVPKLTEKMISNFNIPITPSEIEAIIHASQ